MTNSAPKPVSKLILTFVQFAILAFKGIIVLDLLTWSILLNYNSKIELAITEKG